ncbi:hypothetical protein BGZ98_001885, partial [Dissophora globulifera]
GCPKAYYHARSLKKHELAHESKLGTGALRGSGATHGITATSPSDKTTTSDAGSVSNSASSTVPHHRAHNSHPYNLDYTGGGGGASGRSKHRRHLSQSAAAASAQQQQTTIAAPIPTSSFAGQSLLSPLSDGSFSGGVSPLGLGSVAASGSISPNPASMAAGGAGGGAGGYGQAVTGFNTAMLTPALSTHSSSSSVPTLPMLMNNGGMSGADGSVVMMDAMYQNQGSGLGLSHVGGGGGITGQQQQQQTMPTGTLRSATPTTAGTMVAMPMTMGMTAAAMASLPPTPAMLSSMAAMPAPTLSMVPMMHGDAAGGNVFLVASESLVSLAPPPPLQQQQVSSAMETSLPAQVGADLGYGPMPVDPQQM